LGEAYAKEGDRALAIKNYRKAVELDPTNLQSLRMLRELER
jgi:cytochrome c-type biogenesis protein CcmH/NrfG